MADAADVMTVGDWIQVGVGVVALVAAIVALAVGLIDRRTQLHIARRSLEHDRLKLELEYAVRLATNNNRGGSTDPLERAQLGAEALALTTVVGPRWVPRQWERVTNGKTLEEMAAKLDAPEDEIPRWVKDKNETGLAIRAILAELYKEK
ncbi:hypothetical protein [Microbacterium sp. LWS13-1.2]|uniref:Uncharacterized protein n=1 Tax=Microbacterium sp. LWS13-1.2 TaxID=3135264 RepID=A0AAU6SGK5_9MICO